MKVRVISPDMVAAFPSVPFFASVMVREPSADVVALVGFPAVMPDGTVGFVSVQAILLVPW